jgi:hypothetical protein
MHYENGEGRAMKYKTLIIALTFLAVSCSRPTGKDSLQVQNEPPGIIKRIFVPEYAREWNPIVKAAFFIGPGH